MNPVDLKLDIERTLAPETFPEHPHIMRMLPNEWEKWKVDHLSVLNFRAKSTYHSKATSDRTCQVKWTQKLLCDHGEAYRDRKKENLSPSKRRTRDASIKVNCGAKVIVKQFIQSDELEVAYYWKHDGHDPHSLKDIPGSRNPNGVREWLDSRVANGFDKKSIKAMLRLSEEELSQMEDPDPTTLPYRIKISAMDIYNAVRRRAMGETILSPDIGMSVTKWMERLHEKGWSTLYEPTPGEQGRGGYTLAFCSPWQRKLIAEYGDTVCLDSTHNTCGRKEEKVFLNTVLARDQVTGRGVPLAFMLTNLESHFPLEHYLKWLRRECRFEPETFMIDCSDTEALGINKAFSDRPICILYCYWHLWQAWEKQITAKITFKHMRCKEDRAELLKDLREHLGALLRSETPEEFDRQWEFIQTEYADQKVWLKYMDGEWIRVKERWARAWRKHAHYGIDTNNFIESWHSNLKKNYIGRSRRQRMDYLIRILAEDVERDFRQSHIRCGLGFKGRQLCKAEMEAKSLANTIPYEEAEATISEAQNNEIIINSFASNSLTYKITLQDDTIAACSCPKHLESRLTCKHMFLVHRVTSYAIHMPHTVVLGRREREQIEEETIEDQRAAKRQLIQKVRDELSYITSGDLWKRVDSTEGLDAVSRDSLTQLLAATGTLKHLTKDTLFARPDYTTRR